MRPHNPPISRINELLLSQLPVLKAAKLTELTGAAAAQGNVEQVIYEQNLFCSCHFVVTCVC